MPDPAALFNGTLFDVAVIGGGVVGCATARRLALEGAKVVLIEAGRDILAGASKANSAILHTGFDATVGSLEAEMIRAGREEYLAVREELGLPLLVTGAIVTAWSEGDLARLDAIAEKARRNGVTDVAMLTPEEVARSEPHLAPTCGGLLVPGEHIIDPWSAPLAYLDHAMANGAEFLRDAALSAARFDGSSWRLETAAGTVLTKWAVNCAGLYGDKVDAMLSGEARFSIRPRKGQFVVFDKAARALLNAIILPVPGERTKGVVLCPTIFGNLLVGPTAEEQEDRDAVGVDGATLAALIAKAAAIVPALAGASVTAVYAGLRPATEKSEYRLFCDTERQFVTVGGIRSTGLSAALGLARYVASAFGLKGAAPARPPLRRAPGLAEHGPRDWQSPGRDEIVCHCEMVTRREIAAALEGPLGARDLGGLKRRTRATMGCCQGFYCLARVAAIAGDRMTPTVPEMAGAHG
jgi:glycerol-3-phosphate dehydrogenase